MDKPIQLKTTVTFPIRAEFGPLARSFTETSAAAFGLGERESDKLVLAVEEIFAHFCRRFGGDRPIELEAFNGIHFIRLRMSFQTERIDMSRLWPAIPEYEPADEQSMEKLGIIIGLSGLDRLKLAIRDNRTVLVECYREKAYPPFDPDEEDPSLETLRGAPFDLVSPSDGELLHFTARVNRRLKGLTLPSFLEFPGKVVDMRSTDELSAGLAVCRGGFPVGGVLWRGVGDKLVEVFGPYVFDPNRSSEIAGALLDHCLRNVGRTRAVGLLCRFTQEDLITRQFEVLGRGGCTDYHRGNAVLPVFYRHLEEDAGSLVYCHPRVRDFLRAEYDRLLLPREIVELKDQGEAQAEHSRVTSDLFLASHLAVCRGLVAGRDIRLNLGRLLNLFQTFRRPDVPSGGVLFEMDLGNSHEIGFTPALLEAGFTPALIVPNAGRADRLVFHRPPEPS
ncbi:MAG: hypothetical protein KA419_03150 [Acidobacteria bacterium]|nr:hypothetical protein [Acidobacteriota bacterium]